MRTEALVFAAKLEVVKVIEDSWELFFFWQELIDLSPCIHREEATPETAEATSENANRKDYPAYHGHRCDAWPEATLALNSADFLRGTVSAVHFPDWAPKCFARKAICPTW